METGIGGFDVGGVLRVRAVQKSNDGMIERAGTGDPAFVSDIKLYLCSILSLGSAHNDPAYKFEQFGAPP